MTPELAVSILSELGVIEATYRDEVMPTWKVALIAISIENIKRCVNEATDADERAEVAKARYGWR